MLKTTYSQFASGQYFSIFPYDAYERTTQHREELPQTINGLNDAGERQEYQVTRIPLKDSRYATALLPPDPADNAVKLSFGGSDIGEYRSTLINFECNGPTVYSFAAEQEKIF
jgi:hypothetical protein